MKYIDIHCHLDSADYDIDRQEVLARMRERETGAITIGTDLESSKKAIEIAEESEKTGNKIWACIGVHPENVVSGFPSPEQPVRTGHPGGGEGGVGLFENLVKSSKVVAIGECGLDYFRLKNESEKINQKKLFEQQIEFAVKYNKPLMLHIRSSGKSSQDAYEDALDILENYKKAAGHEAKKLNGNVHFFAANIRIAKRFLDLGFTMSFTGVITFTHDYDEVIKYIPASSIMAETDAPFATPVPYRGKRNEPIFVMEVIKKLAEIRGEDTDILNRELINNSKRIFDIDGII